LLNLHPIFKNFKVSVDVSIPERTDTKTSFEFATCYLKKIENIFASFWFHKLTVYYDLLKKKNLNSSFIDYQLSTADVSLKKLYNKQNSGKASILFVI